MNQSKKTKVLVFSPHPDDLDFSCSGAVAKWTKEGQEVYYCIISGGCKGNHKTKVSEIELRRIRETEQKKAAEVVGAKKVIFLREKDGELENTKELRKKLVKVIREVKPDIVLSFDPANMNFDNFYRAHRDHRLGAEAVFDAIYPAANSEAFFPEIAKKYPPHQIKELWFFASDQPNVYVDISQTIDKKTEALKQHQSQIKDFETTRELVRGWAKEMGKKS